jgi:hypothetical protein
VTRLAAAAASVLPKERRSEELTPKAGRATAAHRAAAAVGFAVVSNQVLERLVQLHCKLSVLQLRFQGAADVASSGRGALLCRCNLVEGHAETAL